MTYVDGFVAAVPTSNREIYKKHAEAAAVVGGLMSLGPNLVDQCRRAADYVDRILKARDRVIFPCKLRPSTKWQSTSRQPKRSA